MDSDICFDDDGGEIVCEDAPVVECWDEDGELVDCPEDEEPESPYLGCKVWKVGCNVCLIDMEGEMGSCTDMMCEDDDVEEFCISWDDMDPVDPEVDECCMDETAECWGCNTGLDLPKVCRKMPDLAGCDDVYDCMHDKACAADYFEMMSVPPVCSCYKAKRVSFCFNLPVDYDGLVDDTWRGMESVQ